MDRRTDIRDYLISRRAKITPDQAGLFPSEGDVRRVPGLRREEVARLAGVSLDYYTELERGALDRASDTVLDAIARALQLDPAERAHLFDLARPAGALRMPASGDHIRASVQRTLDAFGRDPHAARPRELIDELLSVSDDFRRFWARHDVRLPASGRHQFLHPEVGALDLIFEAASLRADPDLTLLLATAQPNTTTDAALAQLATTR